MSVTHAKVSAAPEGADTTAVRPSDWNAGHLGNASVGLLVAASDASAKSIAAADYVCDGVADDVQINAAIAASRAVHLSEGTFLLSTVYDLGWVSYHLLLDRDNLTLSGAGAATIIKSDPTVLLPTPPVMFIAGKTAVAAGLAAAATTVYDVTASVAKGATSITLATPADAANFSPGDHCYIRTGQVLSTGILQPDAEINRIVSATPATGVLVLAWPTAKPYAQEYFISGTAGYTSTTPTANPAVYGVANIESLVTQDITLRDLNLQHDVNVSAFIGAACLRLTLENLTGSFKSNFMSFGSSRFDRVSGCRFHFPGTGAAVYALTSDTGSSDVTWNDNTITGQRVAYLHIHEGSARVNVMGNHLMTAPGSGESQIAVRGRAYDISVIGNILSGNPGGSAIVVDESCTGGGVIIGNTILAASGATIAVASPNWIVENNRTPSADIALYTESDGLETGVRFLSTWVTVANQTAVLGYIPQGAYVFLSQIHVVQAFNSDGTDQISIGPASNHEWYGWLTDVSTTGVKVPTADIVGNGAGDVGHILQAYYLAGGSAPTTGKALVVVGYARIPYRP